MARRSPFLAFVFPLVLLVIAVTILQTNVAHPASATVLASVVIVDEGFEGLFPPNGWFADGHWGKSTCEAYNSSYSAWIEGAADDRGCDGFDKLYHPNESAQLQYGPFDLSDAITATLTFDLWLWQQTGETFLWGASLDGLTFHGITATEAFTTLWEVQSLDLSAVPGLGDLRGQSNVFIGFAWEADGFGETFGGAFVDNVRIVKGVSGSVETATSTPAASTTATSTIQPTTTAVPTQTTTALVYLPAVRNETVLIATPSPMPTATNEPGNHPPVFPAPFLTQKSTELEYDGNGRLVGAVTTITIQTPATDQDGDTISYSWGASNGSIAGNELVGTWTRELESGRVKRGTVTVTASDGHGGTAEVNFEVN